MNRLLGQQEHKLRILAVCNFTRFLVVFPKILLPKTGEELCCHLEFCYGAPPYRPTVMKAWTEIVILF